MASAAAASKIDEDLHSRTLYVLGHEAMAKMSQAKVLLIGLRGLGVEIAKNVILTGVREFALFDNDPTTLLDLAAQFYLTERDIGKPRGPSCVDQLARLNPAVKVHHVDSVGNVNKLNVDLLKSFTVVVMTEGSGALQQKINEFCHSRNICFISSSTPGLCGRVFCDFGEKFVVLDTNGEQPKSFMIASITKDSAGLVTSLLRHGLEDGDFVTFTEVEGMTELNQCKPIKITVKDSYNFEIGDTSKFGTYVRGGTVLQVKQPQALSFKTLAAASQQPGEFMPSDFGKLERASQLHLAFAALDKYKARAGKLPAPGNAKDAAQFVKIANGLNASAPAGHHKVDKVDAKVFTQFAMTCQGNVSPMASVFGGIVGQEVLKACSGKFTPIQQFLYLDSLESLPKKIEESDYKLSNSRYDGQIAAFGKKLQQEIMKQHMFLVGAGAIGCEMLKCWAMMGVGASRGLVHLTDMDNIERSNLSRQFLFREKDVKQPKSTVAAKAATAMNPDFSIRPYVMRVGSDTESHFNEEFWDSLDVVVTALDNVEARLYVDARAMQSCKPMLDSGTLGTKGSTQVVIPRMTENYGASRDPPEAGVPMCTLKHFPYKIEHTVQWARDWFEGEFKQLPVNANQYIQNPTAFADSLDDAMKIKILEDVKAALTTHRPSSFADCIHWARLAFQDMFHNDIAQLIHNFPPDSLTPSGVLFWSGTKRAPNPLTFDATDSAHLEFVVAAANLHATNYGLPNERDHAVFLKVLPSVKVPKFRPKKCKIAANDKEAKALEKQQEDLAKEWDVDGKVRELMATMPRASKLSGVTVRGIDFEKDDATNFHIDFMTACSNMRARCYRIQEASKHKTKGIAGKIIPAIATTTALVTGLVCLELYKTLQRKPIEDYRSAALNMAIPFFSLSEPAPCAATTYKDHRWTAWDSIDVTGPMTLQKFIDHIEEEYDVELQMLSYGVSILFSFFGNAKTKRRRLKMNMRDVSEEVSKTKIAADVKVIFFELCCVDPDDDDEDVDLPVVRYTLR